MKHAYDAAGSQIVAVAHVIASPLVRGLITALHWFATPPFPSRSFGEADEAIAWAREKLGPSRVTVRVTDS
jgi:hypothetical protein